MAFHKPSGATAGKDAMEKIAREELSLVHG